MDDHGDGARGPRRRTPGPLLVSRLQALGLADPRRRSRLLMLLMLLVLINLPVAHSTWQRWRVETSGVDTVAEVVRTEQMGDGFWLSFRYPESVDPDRSQWPAEVDRETWEAARETGEIAVRHLPGRPTAYQVEGQERHWAGVITTVIADLVVLLILLMVWRLGGRRRPLPMRMAAIGDVERCPPGALLEQVEGDLYLVRGEVTSLEDDELWLEVDGQDVIVILDGHHNPVGYQQPAQVRARLLA